MSYILDALKKSEQERTRGETPDVTTRHDPAPPGSRPDSGRPRTLVWLLGGALCANALLFAFWLFSDRRSPDGPQATAPPATQREGSVSAPPAVTRAAAAARPAPARTVAAPPARPLPAPGGSPPRPAQATGGADAAAAQTPGATVPPAGGGNDEDGLREEAAAPAPVPAPSEPQPVSIRELPDRIQRRIPMLEFATHIFGEAPRYREVTINGRRYAEGERVEGMLLSEITETGVVFDFEGYRFEMSVLDDWDY